MFTLTFIVGVQFPEFINHYIQRLSGHLNEAKIQLDKFQTLADSHTAGDISLLVKRYQSNSDPIIIDSATVIEQLLARVDYLENHLSLLTQHDYLEQIKNFILDMDITLVKATAQHFSLAIPLEINALVTGVIFAFTGLLLKEGLNYTGKACSKKLWPDHNR